MSSNAAAVALELDHCDAWKQVGGIVNFDNHTLWHELASVSLLDHGKQLAVVAPPGNGGFGMVTVNGWNG